MLLSEELISFKSECSHWEIERVNKLIEQARDLEEELEQLQDELRGYNLKFRIIEDIAKEVLGGLE